MLTGNPRTARDVIDEAIRENHSGERLLYVLSGASVVVGLFVVLWATVMREGMIAVAGSLCTSLLWPAMRQARQIRKENIALRLLEAPLSKAQTATAAAEMIRRLFEEMFSEPKEKTVPVIGRLERGRAKGLSNVRS